MVFFGMGPNGICNASICICNASICKTCYRSRVGILSPEGLYPRPAAVREGPLIDSVHSRKRRPILPYSTTPPMDLILAAAGHKTMSVSA